MTEWEELKLIEIERRLVQLAKENRALSERLDWIESHCKDLR
jgi:tRNA1(Val) A37 N6-methylase TrmN6